MGVGNNGGYAPTAQHDRLLCLAVLAHWRLRDKNRYDIAENGWAGVQWGPYQSAHARQSPLAVQRLAPKDLSALAVRRIQNTLVRVLHQSLDATARALLFVVNSHNLKVTAARRRERHICLAGPQQRVGFAYLGLRTLAG